MALIFFERVGHEGRRPSPFSWRIKVDFWISLLLQCFVGQLRRFVVDFA
jgi:hypothetical protein